MQRGEIGEGAVLGEGMSSPDRHLGLLDDHLDPSRIERAELVAQSLRLDLARCLARLLHIESVDLAGLRELHGPDSTRLRFTLARRGIRVSNAEIIAAAQNSPPPELVQVPEFQTEGKFDLAKYKRYLASNADPSFLQALEASSAFDRVVLGNESRTDTVRASVRARYRGGERS